MRYSVRFDVTDPSNPGWYAEYYDAEGDVIDDSQKIWHPDMPTDPEAREEAEEIAREYAAQLAKGRMDEPGFGDVEDLAPGIYSATRLNPPSGADCTHLLVRKDGSLGWCNADGESNGSRFSIAELTEAE